MFGTSRVHAKRRSAKSSPFGRRGTQRRGLAARGESLAPFDGPFDSLALSLSNFPGTRILRDLRVLRDFVMNRRRGLPARRLARLGATPDFHHGLVTNLRPKPPNNEPAA